MEKRAREREEKHAVIRERRRQMEEERLRLKQQVNTLKRDIIIVVNVNSLGLVVIAGGIGESSNG